MGKNTSIEWCDHTFSPWWGCTKVAAGCAHCYAETFARRFGVGWGNGSERRIASERSWRQPLAWERAARHRADCPHTSLTGTEPAYRCDGCGAIVTTAPDPKHDGFVVERFHRPRVFCGSMCDVFEARPELDAPRDRLSRLIEQTPNLDWLLLTKRPENIRPMLSFQQAAPIENLWVGCSIATQADADRNLPLLMAVPAVVRFLSIEPLIEPIDFGDEFRESANCPEWVIVGGESGPNARPCRIEWIRSIVAQCREARVPCFVKQIGSLVPWETDGSRPVEQWPFLTFGDGDGYAVLRDRKGGDMAEWPEDLRVREFTDAKETA